MIFGVFIGNFQPIHKGHISLIFNALSQCDKLILVVGTLSTLNTERSGDNPFLTNERIDMIKYCFDKESLNKIIFISVPDFYNDILWSDFIKDNINNIVKNFTSKYVIKLFDCDKDNNKYYLILFPEYEYNIIATNDYKYVNSTMIRYKYFSAKLIDTDNLHENVVKYLECFLLLSSCLFL
jgi:bifunctional NMN adenylyltransferase/nudix hydrolase